MNLKKVATKIEKLSNALGWSEEDILDSLELGGIINEEYDELYELLECGKDEEF